MGVWAYSCLTAASFGLAEKHNTIGPIHPAFAFPKPAERFNQTANILGCDHPGVHKYDSGVVNALFSPSLEEGANSSLIGASANGLAAAGEGKAPLAATFEKATQNRRPHVPLSPS